MSNLHTSLEKALASNLRARRTERGWSQETLAREVSERIGLAWTRDTVASIERATRPANLADVLALVAVLEVGLEKLLQGGAALRLGTRMQFTPAGVLAMLNGDLPKETATVVNGTLDPTEPMGLEQAWQRLVSLWPEQCWQDLPYAEAATLNLAERKAAARLGVSARTVVAASMGLWKGSLTDERDRLLRVANMATPGVRSTAALRGHITRGLFEQLKNKLHGRRCVAESESTIR